jgi:hypothetical protein
LGLILRDRADRGTVYEQLKAIRSPCQQYWQTPRRDRILLW